MVAIGAALFAQRGAAQAAGYERTLIAIQNEIQNGNLQHAQELVERAKVSFPANGGVENLAGVIAIEQGQAEKAEKEFTAAIRHSPRLTGAYLNLGRLYRQKVAKDPKAEASALRVYERALAIAPGDPEANYNAAELLMHSGAYARSLANRAKLPERDQQSTSMLVVAVADEAALGRAVEADKDAAALAAQSDLTEADVLEASEALRKGHRADLIEKLLESAASHQALSAVGLRLLGLAHEADQKLPEAQQNLERAFALDGKSTAILADLARVAEEREDYKGALGYLAHARDLAPKNAELAYRFGMDCLKMSLLAESRKALEEAVNLAPGNAGYLLKLGTVTDFAKGPNDALPLLTKYHTMRPADANGVLALGMTEFRAKDYDAAANWLTQALKNPGTAGTAHYYLGRVAREKGELDEALEHLTQAVKATPDRPEVVAELGQVYLQMKRYPDAEKELTRAASLDEDNYAANFGLLQLYARTGDARREQQAKHFNEIKEKQEQQYREMMRVLEVKPE